MRYGIMIILLVIIGMIGFTNNSVAQTITLPQKIVLNIYLLDPITSEIAINAEPCSKNKQNSDYGVK